MALSPGSQIKNYTAATAPEADWYLVAQDPNEGTASLATKSVLISDLLKGNASTALDNLASVAINTSLISDTDATDNLGSAAKKWLEGFLNRITIEEGGSTTTPAAGDVALYAKADGLLYSKDDAGAEVLVSGGTGGGAGVDGWIEVSDAWAYASATTITVPSGAAAIYSVGDKIKLTQTTVKYFSIISVADTVLTVTGGSDYTVANAAITLPYYSHQETPVGFPAFFNWSPTWSAGITIGNAEVVTKFKVVSELVTVVVSVKLGNTSAISGHVTLTPPVTNSETVMFPVNIEDAGTTTLFGNVAFNKAGAIAVFQGNTSGTYYTYTLFTSTVPFTWTTDDKFSFTGTYPIG